MNELLSGLVVPDGYTDAATLGPEPGQMTGADITCRRADVLMQFAVEVDGGGVWLENREYPMNPGSKHATNICGVRFRNRIAGDAAIVDASLTGPSQPQLSPLQHLPATGIGDVLLNQLVPPTSPTTFGPFDIGDWPYLLLGLQIGQVANTGARLQATWDLATTGIVNPSAGLDIFVPAGGFFGEAGRGWAVVPNITRQVLITINQTGVVGNSRLFVAPTAVPECPVWSFLGDDPFQPVFANVNPGNVVAAGGGTDIFTMLPPFRGMGRTIFRPNATAGAGPWDILAKACDYTGANLTTVFEAQRLPTGDTYTFDHPMGPYPIRVLITNNGTASQTYQLYSAALLGGNTP